MEIRLHIGAHRTGSTRVQAELSRRAAHLASRGVATAWPEQLRRGKTRLARLYPRLPGPLQTAVAARALPGLIAARDAAAAQGARVLLVSEENLAGSIDAILRSGRLYPDIGRRLRGLRPVLSETPVTLLLAVRSYDGFFASAYAHRTTRGPRPDFDQLKQRFMAMPRRWPEVLSDVLRALPHARLRVWDYDASRSNELGMMREVIGLSDIVAVNAAMPDLPAPSARAVEVLNAMTEPDQQDLAQRRAAAGRYPRPDYPPFDPWTHGQTALLQEVYAQDLTAIRAMEGDRLTFIDLAEHYDA